MSSTRKPQQRGKAGGPAPERKAPAGPLITPQVLSVFFILVIGIGVGVYFGTVVKKGKEKMEELNGKEQTAITNIDTYRKKGEKLVLAGKLNETIRDKLQTVVYMFMTDQSSIVPFYEDTLYPLLTTSGLRGGKLEVDAYTFTINAAMDPFNTVPGSLYFEDPMTLVKAFPVKYIGEQNGVMPEGPIDSRPSAYLTPYRMKLIEFNGTFEQARKFIKKLQEEKEKIIFTVHCLKNDDQSNAGVFRTSTNWTMVMHVYFINPEATASGDMPPSPPGSESC